MLMWNLFINDRLLVLISREFGGAVASVAESVELQVFHQL